MRRIAHALVLAVLPLGGARAQESPGPPVVPCGVPMAPLPPCGPAASPPPTVAVVDGQAITLADLDEKIRKRIEGLAEAVAEARRAAVEAEIAEALVALEAQKRGVAAADLWYAEVTRKAAPASDAEVKAEYEAHPDWFKTTPLEEARLGIASKVRARHESEQRDGFVKELRSRFAVKPGEDPNGRDLKPTSVLAVVGDRRMTLGSAATRIEAAVFAVRWGAWYEEKRVLETLVHERLLKFEAGKRGATPEAVTKAEVSDKLPTPTDEELAKCYAENRRWFGGDLASEKGRVVEFWTREKTRTLEKDFDDRIRAGHTVKLLFDEPERPVLVVDVANSPARGDMNAAATIVEFGDFECPPCGIMYERMEEALKPYGSRVRYVFRSFPMSFHPFAPKAAEAALAAHAQGKFWEYAGLLFTHQKALDVPSLKRYAVEAGLDAARFNEALDGNRFAAAVRRDVRDGERYGVQGTPTFFVNGVQLRFSDYEVSGIRAAVDAALASSASAASPAR